MSFLKLLKQRQSQACHVFRGEPLGHPDQPGQEPGAALGATMSRDRAAYGKHPSIQQSKRLTRF